VDGGDQQVRQAVGDLAPAQVAEGGQQGQADRAGVAAQLVQLLSPDAAAVGEQHARGHAIEQVRGQGQRADAPQLVGLLAHALQPSWAGAGPQHKQGRSGSALLPVFGIVARTALLGQAEQGVETCGRLGRQTREYGGAERLLLAVQGGAHQTLQALGRGRLQLQYPAALARRGQQPVVPALQGEHPAVESAGQGPRVLLRSLAEAEGGADLGAVVLDGPPLPGVAVPRRRGHADLGGDGLDRGQRHVLGAAREAALGLEQLEQHGKAQARRAALVAEQRAVGRAQGPAVTGVTVGLSGPRRAASRLDHAIYGSGYPARTWGAGAAAPAAKEGSGANASLWRRSSGTPRPSSAVSVAAMKPSGPQ